MKEKAVFKMHDLQSALDLVRALTLEQYIVYGEYPYENRIIHHKVTVLEEEPDSPAYDLKVRDKEPL